MSVTNESLSDSVYRATIMAPFSISSWNRIGGNAFRKRFTSSIRNVNQWILYSDDNVITYFAKSFLDGDVYQ